MTTLKGTFYFERDKNRLFQHLLSFLTLYGCINITLSYLATGRAKFKPGDSGEAECKQFPLKVRHPTGGLVEMAIAGPRVVRFPLEISDTPLHLFRAPVTTDAFGETVRYAISTVLVNYYETQIPWLCDNVSTDTYAWPSEWNFARAVRNAATHGGTLNWKNDKAPPVSWHHLSYSARERGRRVIGDDLDLGDLLVLMLEMDHALDRVGCPI